MVGTDATNQEILEIQLPNMRIENLNLANLDVRSLPGAYAALDLINTATSFVSQERSRMGAYQNRLEHTIKNLDNQVENTQYAESAIRDADMAEEMVGFQINQVPAAGRPGDAGSGESEWTGHPFFTAVKIIQESNTLKITK